MEYAEVIFARLDAPPSEALSRVSGIAAGLGWEIEEGYTDRDFFCRLPPEIAGAPDVFLQVRTSPGEHMLVCELRHNFMEDVGRYRAVLSAAVKVVSERYREAHRHNLDPFIEMFPKN
jgi:hypothetical protein